MCARAVAWEDGLPNPFQTQGSCHPEGRPVLQAQCSLLGLRLLVGLLLAVPSLLPCGIGMVGYSCRFILELCNLFIFIFIF